MSDIIKCPDCKSTDVVMYQECITFVQYELIENEWEANGEYGDFKDTGYIEFQCKKCDHIWKND